MRIVFIGAVRFSEQALNKLIEIKSSIVGVCTLEYSDFNSDHVDLSPLSRKNNIPVRYTPNINSKDVIDWISDLAPDVIFCFGWSRLIKKRLLNTAPLGVIGFHPALLPVNRGRHPLIWSLILGLKETGSSFFFMDEGADSGDILSQRNVSICEMDDAGTLYEKVTKTAMNQIEQFVPTLANTSFKRYPQDHSKASYWRKRGRLDGQIDWRMSAHTIHNLVRGLTKPYVGAHFICDGKDVKVWKSEPVKETTLNIEPGKILSVDTRGVVVKTGIDALRLVHIEPQISVDRREYL
ncbi:MAG: formyl transferase [Nitrospinae bacterium]|nr:formyl transferase [Nitrospinota bacterium]